MNETQSFIYTWICGKCGYSQNFDPADTALWNININQDPQLTAKYGPIPQGNCPACFTGMTISKQRDISSVLDKAIDLSQMSKTSVSSDAQIEATLVPDLDANGQPIMEATGEVRYQFNPMTGQIDPVQVMAPKMRPIGQDALDALKLQRDQNLDALESVAVSETTEADPEAV